MSDATALATTASSSRESDVSIRRSAAPGTSANSMPATSRVTRGGGSGRAVGGNNDGVVTALGSAPAVASTTGGGDVGASGSTGRGAQAARERTQVRRDQDQVVDLAGGLGDARPS